MKLTHVKSLSVDTKHPHTGQHTGRYLSVTWQLYSGGIPCIDPSDAHEVCWVHGPQVHLHQHLRTGSVMGWLPCRGVEARQAANQKCSLQLETRAPYAQPCSTTCGVCKVQRLQETLYRQLCAIAARSDVLVWTGQKRLRPFTAESYTQSRRMERRHSSINAHRLVQESCTCCSDTHDTPVSFHSAGSSEQCRSWPRSSSRVE